MKTLGTLEKAMLVLALVFLALGTYSVVHPSAAVMIHSSAGRRGGSVHAPNPPELVSPNGARVYGLLCVGVGAGLAWLALQRPGK